MSYQGESGWPSCVNCGHAHPDGVCTRNEWSYKDRDYVPCGCERYITRTGAYSVVERGHDERPATREPDDMLRTFREADEMFGHDDDGWAPDERTVKAVVEALREMADTACLEDKVAWRIAADRLAERFNFKGDRR